MGTAQSAAARTQRGSKKARINRLRQTQADIDDLEKQIHAIKILLYRTQVKGIMQRDKRDEVIHDIKTLTYQKKTDLIKKGKKISSSISFQEYLRIARNPLNKQSTTKKDVPEKEQTASTDTPSKVIENGSRINSAGSDGEASDNAPPPVKKPNSEAKPSRLYNAIMVLPRNLPLANTLFSYLEAYLLKRLHMAMLQEHQQTIHRDCWSNHVSDLFLEIEPLRKDAITILSKLRRRTDAGIDRNEGMKKVYEDHLRLQELLIYRYEQVPWEKVEALVEDEIKFEDVDESKHMA